MLGYFKYINNKIKQIKFVKASYILLLVRLLLVRFKIHDTEKINSKNSTVIGFKKKLTYLGKP